MEKKDELIIGIDCTRSSSGGAISHIKCILNNLDPEKFGIFKVHMWGFKELNNQVINKKWLTKHDVRRKNRNILIQILWQYFMLPVLSKKYSLDIIFNTDSGSVCRFKPNITLNQDLLSFEKGEKERFPFFSYMRLRLEILKILQVNTLKNSNLSIFLSSYSAKLIQSKTGKINKVIIPHGLDNDFFKVKKHNKHILVGGVINLLYISNISLYKHQWKVIEGISKLIERTGLKINLRLIGNLEQNSKYKFQKAIDLYDPNKLFVIRKPFQSRAEIMKEFLLADIFIFASSCETFGITLLEAMAIGLPIACSNRSSLPEIAGNTVEYFDPENPKTIDDAVYSLISNDKLRLEIAKKTKLRAKKFTWEKCSNMTWENIVTTAKLFKN